MFSEMLIKVPLHHNACDLFKFLEHRFHGDFIYHFADALVFPIDVRGNLA